MNAICTAIKEPVSEIYTVEDVFITMKMFGSYEKDDIFGDTVPYKSITVVCENTVADYDSVRYCLEYVLGSGCIEKTASVENGNKMAIRANYCCW